MQQAKITSGGEEITDLKELAVGDEVIWGDRSKPLTVTQLGEREQETNDRDMLITGAARVEGDWANAVPFALLHKTRTLDENHEVVYRQMGIVACERGNVEKGNEITLRRVASEVDQ